MRQIINFLCLVLLVTFTVDLQAQRSDDNDREDSGFDAADRLWYGIGLNGSGIIITSNEFALGLSPMVAYKFTKNLSAGIRLPLDYSYLKIVNPGNDNITDNKLDWGLGAFARAKIFRGVFAHTEYNELFLNERVVINGFYQLDPSDPTKLDKRRINRNQFNVGLGYSSGGEFSYELSVLYNVIEPNNSSYNPWSIRAGFNFNF